MRIRTAAMADLKTVTDIEAACFPAAEVASEADFAARLLEAAGLKGTSCGGAQISPKHSNFIVNLGGARASDVMYLIQKAKAEVERQFGVCLETEIRPIGRF